MRDNLEKDETSVYFSKMRTELLVLMKSKALELLKETDPIKKLKIKQVVNEYGILCRTLKTYIK
jgi:hypothetical protein